MIRTCLCFMIILAFHHNLSTKATEPVNIEKRIEGLKKEILQEIQDDRDKADQSQTKNPQNDYYDYIVTEADNGLIKPIINNVHIPHQHKYRLELETNLTATTPKIKKVRKVKKAQNLTERILPKAIQGKVTPADLFYRRFYLDEEERNKPQKWTHCLDLVTPRLKGFKDDWKPKQVTSTDPDIRRLAHLLSLNTTDYTKEEIVSTLYQISNIHLRIFQWDYTAVTTIFNIIIPGAEHSFRSLKHAIKELFRKWHLDTNMLDVFLKQTRIFRPPCIDVSEYGGSTKTTGGVRYDKTTPKNSDDEDCD